MSKQTEALKLALEALKEVSYDQAYATEIAAIREALADSALERMAENARELGLDYEAAQQQEPVGEAYLCDKCQTPFDGAYYCPECGHNTATKESVYTSPPASKPWVGLTEKEKRDARNSVSYSPLAMTMGEWTEAVQDATEAKLREKNT